MLGTLHKSNVTMKLTVSKPRVRVVAHVVALPEKVEQVKLILLGLIEPTRQESGCIHYELLQNQEDPADFVFVEDWESKALLNAHLESPHINEVDALIRWIVSR